MAVKCFSALLLFFIAFTSYGAYWVEGACDKYGKYFEGANMRYAYSAAQVRWLQQGGDWLDAIGENYGQQPYASAVIPLHTTKAPVEFNITSLVNEWIDRPESNNGLMIRNLSSLVLFHSRESNQAAYKPRLVINLRGNKQQVIEYARQDTYLFSDYKCAGDASSLKGNGNILIAFDVSAIAEPIESAYLQLHLLRKVGRKHVANIYKVAEPKALAAPNMLAFSGLDKVYETNFESDDWQQGWQLDPKSKIRLVTSNQLEGFEPLSGKALQIDLEKGQHYALNGHYKLVREPETSFDFFTTNTSDKAVNHACFSYALRFGRSWSPETVGKLPGFSGRYSEYSYAGGWGGRTSNGNNGWSARGLFQPVIVGNNQFRDSTPVGSYIYHSKMTGKWGGHYVWGQPAVLQNEKWYQLKQCIQMNHINKNDGRLITWVDGELAYVMEQVNFSNNPKVAIESLWLNVYHGGKRPAHKDMTLFIDNLKLWSRQSESRAY